MAWQKGGFRSHARSACVHLVLLSQFVEVVRRTAASQQPRSCDLRLRFPAMADSIHA